MYASFRTGAPVNLAPTKNNAINPKPARKPGCRLTQTAMSRGNSHRYFSATPRNNRTRKSAKKKNGEHFRPSDRAHGNLGNSETHQRSRQHSGANSQQYRGRSRAGDKAKQRNRNIAAQAVKAVENQARPLRVHPGLSRGGVGEEIAAGNVAGFHQIPRVAKLPEQIVAGDGAEASHCRVNHHRRGPQQGRPVRSR